MHYPPDTKYHHRSFPKLYMRLVKELRALGIDNESEYVQIREIRDYFTEQDRLHSLEFGFTWNLKKLIANLQHQLSSISGISIVGNGLATSASDDQKKKLLAFSEVSILPTEGIAMQDMHVGPDRGLVDFWYGPNLQGCVSAAFSHLADIKSGAFIPLPSTIEWLDEDEYYDAHFNEDIDHLDEFAAATSLIKPLENVFTLSSDGNFLGHANDISKVGLLLPTLQNIPLETVRKIRLDYQDEFLRFQSALRKFKHKSQAICDEHAMRMLIQEIDDEIDKLHNTFKKIAKTHKHIHAMVAMVGVMFYVTNALPDTAEFLYSVCSGLGVATYFEYIRNVKDANNKIEDSPFYFPFLLSNYGK